MSVFILNYFLVILFLKGYYLSYFFLLLLSALFVYKTNIIRGYLRYICLSMFLVSVVIFEYFDDEIFDFYLYFNLDRFYIYMGGTISYVLAFLHSIFFFFVTFKRS